MKVQALALAAHATLKSKNLANAGYVDQLARQAVAGRCEGYSEGLRLNGAAPQTWAAGAIELVRWAFAFFHAASLPKPFRGTSAYAAYR